MCSIYENCSIYTCCTICYGLTHVTCTLMDLRKAPFIAVLSNGDAHDSIVDGADCNHAAPQADTDAQCIPPDSSHTY